MGIPRAAVLGIAGVVLIAGVFLFTRQSTEPEGPVPAPVAAAPVTPAPKPAPGETKSVTTSEVSEETPAAQVPPKVKRAVEDGRVVVLLFTQDGADDRATAKRVHELSATGPASFGKRFVVFTDGVAKLGEYAAVIGDLGIDQAPATIIVAPNGEARVVQGFIDQRSLRQYVADALG
jgi:hypothetical protein